MSKPKVLIVSWDGVNDTGGLERVTQYMIEAWDSQYSIEIAQLSDLERYQFYKVFLHRHYVMDAFLMSLYVNKRIRAIGRNNVTVITQGYNAPFVKADIAYAHGTMKALKMAIEGENPKWHFNQWFEKISFKRAKCVIAVAKHAQEEMCRLYGVRKKKVKVINNCVDTDIFYPRTDALLGGVNVLFCGRLEKRKGIDRLYELAQKIETENDMNLIIATPSDYNVQRFRKLKRTTIKTGLKKEDMNAFYNSGNVMYFPSLYEGFEMVTGECLSAGVPVLGNAVGAIDELHSKGQKGIALIGETIEEDIIKLRRLASQFSELSARESLHEDMVKNYGFKRYSMQLRRLMDTIR